jgi:hypothetical protein
MDYLITALGESTQKYKSNAPETPKKINKNGFSEFALVY